MYDSLSLFFLTLRRVERVPLRHADAELEDAALVRRLVGAVDDGLQLVQLVTGGPHGGAARRCLESEGGNGQGKRVNT